MQHIEQIEQHVARLDQYLLDGLQPWQAQLNVLQTLTGTDQSGAARLLVEIGVDMTAFGSAERLASWVGICPGNNESAGKRKSGKSAVVTPGAAGCCASSHRLRRERAAPSRTSSKRWRSARATRSPSWRLRTRSCARSTRCWPAVPGQGRRLRSIERGAQCPALAHDVAQMRRYRHAQRGLTHILPPHLMPRPALGQDFARPTTRFFHANNAPEKSHGDTKEQLMDLAERPAALGCSHMNTSKSVGTGWKAGCWHSCVSFVCVVL